MKEMAQKSKVFFQEILFFNENSYGDCVNILAQFEKWIHMLYNPDLPGNNNKLVFILDHSATSFAAIKDASWWLKTQSNQL